MEFSSFYQGGGLAMHPITLLSLVGVGLLVRRGRALYGAVSGRGPASFAFGRDDQLLWTTLAAMLATGLLGFFMALAETGWALRTVPLEQQWAVFALALPLVATTGIWSTICALPLLLTHGVLRHYEARLVPTRDRAEA